MAPPKVATVLSMPLGVPWHTFSATKAQPLTASACSGLIDLRPLCSALAATALAAAGKGKCAFV